MKSLVKKESSEPVQGSLWEMAHKAQVITLIGAGGKTTCLRSLTQEIHTAGHQVIATTTTKVFPEPGIKAKKQPNPPNLLSGEACFWYQDVETEHGKWLGPSLEAVDQAISENLQQLPAFKTFWVIEGDGARMLRLKCWAPHEPQIPFHNDCAILVIDRNLWGQILQAKQIHRWEYCRDLLGQTWNEESAWRYFLKSPVFNPKYQNMSWVILLNSSNLLGSEDSLRKLSVQWTKIQEDPKENENKPLHLRLAEGDAKEGKIQWFDLW